MIQINDKVRVTRCDKLNLQLEVLEEVNKKDGTTAKEWKWKGYYSDLQTAVSGALKHCLMLLADEEITDLKQIIKRIDEIGKELKGEYNKNGNQ